MKYFNKTWTNIEAGDDGAIEPVMANLREAGRLGADMIPKDTNAVPITDGSLDNGTALNPWGDTYIKAGKKYYIGGTALEAEAGFKNNSFGYIPNNNVDEFKVIELGIGADQAVEIDDFGGTWFGSDGSFFSKTVENTVLTSATTPAITAADGSNPRWDLISIDASAGTYSVTEGTASASPVYPATPAGEDALAYIQRPAGVDTIYSRNIFDARQSTKVKTVDGHFKTNFSVDQKEDTEASEYDNQQMFQMIPFETKFDSLQADKTFLHTVETVLVPADSHEIVEDGTWADDDRASHKFGRAREGGANASTSILSFSGVGCGVAFKYDTDRGIISVELSSDGGSTWGNKKILADEASSGIYNAPLECYSGLEYGDYQIKLTVVYKGATGAWVEYFYYTTYMIQQPITQYSLTSGSATDLDDVPPTTALFTGTWERICDLDTNSWNSNVARNTNTDADVQFKFYGSKCWVNVKWTTSGDADVTVTIDGSGSKVKSATFNADTPNNAVPAWIRLDDGTLDEGWHTIELHTTAATGYVNYCGFGYYSENAPTTVARSLICGGYDIGADNSAFTYAGTWTASAGISGAFLRRERFTTTINSTVTFDTPAADIRAIYLNCGVENSVGAEISITIGAGSTRYLTLDTNNYDQDSMRFLLYDSFHDGDLADKEIIIKNVDGNDFPFQGITYEIGDPVEDDSIWCAPKWTRYNNSGTPDTCVSASHRIDVYGAKSDGKQGRLPSVHSGFCYNSGYYRHGLGLMAHDLTFELWQDSIPSNYDLDATVRTSSKLPIVGDPGLMYQAGGAAWNKVVIKPNRVV